MLFKRLALVRMSSALALALFAAACGGDRIPGEIGSDMESANAAVEDLISDLPEQARSDFERRAAEAEQRLTESFERAAAGQNLARSLGGYVDDRLGTVTRLTTSISELTAKLNEDADKEQNADLAAFGRNSLKVHLALAIRERALNESFIQRATEKDRAVAEAIRRWRALPEPKPSRVSFIAEGLAFEPCAFTTGGKPASGKFALEGVEIGMKRDDAVAALCAAHGDSVRMQGPLGHAMTHGIAWRDLGFDERTTLAELPWTMSVPYIPSYDAGLARQRLSRSFEVSRTFCFECKPDRPGAPPKPGFAGNLTLLELPDGRVAGLTRFVRFAADSATAGSARPGEARIQQPVPLKEALGAYESRFGKPSFQYELSGEPMVGWVFPTGETPLAPERWFATADKAVWRSQLHLNKVGLVEGGNWSIDADKLAAQRARATYCMARHFHVNSVNTGLPGFPYDSAWQQAEIYLTSGQKPEARSLPLRYDTRFENPAFLDRCGTIVLVKIQRSPGRDGVVSIDEATAPLTPSTPVYAMTIQIVDTNAVRGVFVAEEQQVYAQLPEALRRGAPAVRTLGRPSGLGRAAALSLAQKGRSAAYGRWMTCLHSRLRNTYDTSDEARCASLRPTVD